jgi:methyl-accepting chemotaxis protein
MFCLFFWIFVKLTTKKGEGIDKMSKNLNQLKVKAGYGHMRRKILLSFIIFGIITIIFNSILMANKGNFTLGLILTILYFGATMFWGFSLSASITRPINQVRDTLRQLRLGHLDAHCNINTKDDIGQLARDVNGFAADVKDTIIGTVNKIASGDVSMNVERKDKDDMVAPALEKIILCMRSLSHDTERIISEASHGNLNERCDTSSYKGSWKYLIDGINNLLDNISSPFNEVMEVMRNLSVNDYTHFVRGTYEGSFTDLSNDVNAVRENLLAMQGAVVRVSKGNTDELEEFIKIGKKSENDYMTPSIIRLMETIRALVAEMKHMTDESLNGNINNNRGDLSKFEGGYREIIAGVNSTLESITKPMYETTVILDAMAVNDFTANFDSSLMVGDYARLGGAIEQVQDRLISLQDLSIQISYGDISGLESLKATGKRSENDKLTPAFTKMMQSLSNLIDETTAIANAALEGRLEYRSNTDNFEGEFANILKSFNSAFHNMAKPIKEISNVMDEISKGNLSAAVTGDYKGVFDKLSHVVNDTVGNINNIVGQISYVLTNIANSNLDIEKVEPYNGDFANISSGINTIIDALNELISKISMASDQVASGAKQVSEGSQNLSQGATEQASSVEQLTASISEISSQTKNNAVNASKANNLVISTKDSAMLGSKQMNEMLVSMNDINESSSNISKIIKVIDDIAFQTNILALNAAVEAARAGQYGKGFAVVAEEVRNLAARSANAANDTTNLIEGSISKIESGMKIANNTASALSDIVTSVDKVTDLVSEIATSSNQQATGISQIDKGVEVVSNVVQTNSATAEESAAASEQLSSQAEYLKELLSKFKFKDL